MAPRPVVLRLRRDLDQPLDPPVWPSGMSIRTLASKDAKPAHEVLAAGYWEGGGGAPKFRTWWTQVRRDSEFDPSLFFLAIDGQGVVGLAQCWTSAFVKDLAVHPRARRRGVGRALMLTAFGAFKARNAPFVDLKVGESNAPARALYGKLGMREIAREPG